MRLTIVLIAILLLSIPCRAEDVIERRGADPPLTGVVVGLTDAGVTMRSATGGEHFVPWDLVRDIQMNPPEPTLEARLQRARDLWRARSRLQRGDAGLAEDLFVRLFEYYRGQTHETALVVAEGLLRCRIAHGANTAAIIPALEVARLHVADVRIDTYSSLPPVLDEQTLLCPHLPPAWVHTRALSRLERDLAGYTSDDPVINELARLYRIAAARQWDPTVMVMDLGPPEAEVGQVDTDVPRHPGVRLLQMLITVSDPDRAVRAEAQASLATQLDELLPWTEAWARFAVGASLVRESGAGRRQRGLVHLLHLPARFPRSQPYLTGLSLAWAVEASRAFGDSATADTLQAELTRLVPHHPAIGIKQPVAFKMLTDES